MASDPMTQSAPLPQILLNRRTRTIAGVAAVILGGAGVTATFTTDNDTGSATLMAVALYLTVAWAQGKFPKLKLGGNEIDPHDVDEAKTEAGKASVNSRDAVEGLADTRDRLTALEARLAALGLPSGSGDPTAARRDAGPDADAHALRDRLEELAGEYNEIRWTMPSGATRTRSMDEVYRQMKEACLGSTDSVDVPGLLASTDNGRRLAGVAHLEVRPQVELIPVLARAAVEYDKPYNEYQALRTLRQLLRGNCGRLTPDLRRLLEDRFRRLSPGVDRARVISGILNDCP